MRVYGFAKAFVGLALFLPSFFVSAPFVSATQEPIAQHNAEARPAIQVQAPSYNFGTAVQGATVEHTFTVRNGGKTVLKIEHVKVA